MSPVYLQTVEAYSEYFDHLSDDGILHINHHIYPRMIATAAKAWKASGREDFRRHVVVFQRHLQWDTLPTLLIKMSPWTREQLDQAVHLMSWCEKPRTLVENPLDSESSFLSDVFYAGEISPELLARIAPSRQLQHH